MERLTQWYDDGEHKGIMVKEDYENNVLKTLFTENDEGYVAMKTLKHLEDMAQEGKLLKLPCKEKGKVYLISYRYTECSEYGKNLKNQVV